jgi:two-component system nitrogen regulation sensor histidine kinase NtrY
MTSSQPARAFNRNDQPASAQRGELMEAYRRSTSAALHRDRAVRRLRRASSGLDATGRINLPNRTASELLASTSMPRPGCTWRGWRRNSRICGRGAGRSRTAADGGDPIGPPAHRRMLIARIGAERSPAASPASC